jgi:Conserved TM helix
LPPILAVELDQGIEDAWSDVATFVPKLVGFLIVVVLGWFVAKAIARIADGVLERVGFDKAVERGGVKRALESSKYDASDIVGKLVFYALFLFVLQFAFGLFGDNPVSDLISGVIAYLPKVFAAILIVVVTGAIAAAVKSLIEGALGGLEYGRLLAGAASVAIIGVGVFAALNQLQIAPAIVNGLFYAILAVVAGSLIIAVGGGGVGPMRAQWEKAFRRMEEEAPRIREQRSAARERIEARVQGAAARTQAAAGNSSHSSTS